MVNLSFFWLLTQGFAGPCLKQRLVLDGVGRVLCFYISLCRFLFSWILPSRETNSHHASRPHLCWHKCVSKKISWVEVFFVPRKCSALLWSDTKGSLSLQRKVMSGWAPRILIKGPPLLFPGTAAPFSDTEKCWEKSRDPLLTRW